MKFLQYDNLFCLLVKYVKNTNTHTTKLCNRKRNKHQAKTNKQRPKTNKQGIKSNEQHEKINEQ